MRSLRVSLAAAAMIALAQSMGLDKQIKEVFLP